eukprot:scaffold18330_cov100-Isochrysis_galbana.AAC.1
MRLSAAECSPQRRGGAAVPPLRKRDGVRQAARGGRPAGHAPAAPPAPRGTVWGQPSNRRGRIRLGRPAHSSADPGGVAEGGAGAMAGRSALDGRASPERRGKGVGVQQVSAPPVEAPHPHRRVQLLQGLELPIGTGGAAQRSAGGAAGDDAVGEGWCRGPRESVRQATGGADAAAGSRGDLLLHPAHSHPPEPIGPPGGIHSPPGTSGGAPGAAGGQPTHAPAASTRALRIAVAAARPDVSAHATAS